MAGKRFALLRLLFGNVWAWLCLLAAGSGTALTAQVLMRAPPFDSDRFASRLFIGAPAAFGALAGVYGLIAGSLLALRSEKKRSSQHELRTLRRRVQQLEALHLDQRARLEELSTLREVATVINQESDFNIIAEKVLELVQGLLEPAEATIFLLDEESGQLEPFAQLADGKYMDADKALTRSIPEFDLSEFESHSVVCRLHGQELHAVVPMKVEEKTLGALFLVFPTDARPKDEQTTQFNRTRRRVLLEIAHHISLAVKTKHLHTRAVVDTLTRLYSRSHFNSQMQAALDYARRTEDPFSLLLLDIDHFKKINDTYGHDTGDVILQKVAKRIQRKLRKYDTAYRYGGEEIAVLLPRTNLQDALTIADRLRRTIGGRKFRGAQNRLVKATVSIGAARYREGDDERTLFRRADERLYEAKDGGRNCVRPKAA